MVVAYVSGYSVTRDYLAKNPHLRFASGADDTGVIVSYNTHSPDVTGANPVVVPGALVINPITWTRTDATASAESNLGSMMPQADGTLVLKTGLADARVNASKGVLECTTCDPNVYSSSDAAFPHGVFHPYDYNFYYRNLRANAEARVAAFLAQQ